MKTIFSPVARGVLVLTSAALLLCAGCTIHIGSDESQSATSHGFRSHQDATLEIDLPYWDRPITDQTPLTGTWRAERKTLDFLADPDDSERPVQLRFRSTLEDGRNFEYSTSWLPKNKFRIVQSPEESFGETILEAPLSTARLLLRGERDGSTVEGHAEIFPDPGFLEEGGKLLKGDLTVGQLIRFGMQREPLNYIKLVTAGGDDWTWSEVLLLHQRGVNPNFITSLRQPPTTPQPGASGEPAERPSRDPFTANDIVLLHSRGVTVDYVEQLDAAGTAFSASDLVLLHSRGVTAGYARAVAASGLNPAASDLTLLHSRGVTAPFIAAVAEAGYRYNAQDLVLLHSRGVQADYLRALKAAGYNYSSQDVVLLHGRGVRADYLAAIADDQFKPLSASEVLHLHRSGVPPETVNRLRK